MRCYYCQGERVKGYVLCFNHLPSEAQEKVRKAKEKIIRELKIKAWLKNKRACEKWAATQDRKALTVRY